jgi:hypothetical protein
MLSSGTVTLGGFGHLGAGIDGTAGIDGATEDLPVAQENDADDERPANASEDRSPPSCPSTTGVLDSLPATTGITSTSEVTTVLRQTLAARRPLRWPAARRTAAVRRPHDRVRRVARRGTSG